MYDLISKVFEVFFETTNPIFNKLTLKIILNFIEKLPINKELVFSYVTTFLNNIEVREDSKRLEIIEVLSKIFTKYTINFFEKYLNIYILKVVTARANEKEAHI